MRDRYLDIYSKGSTHSNNDMLRARQSLNPLAKTLNTSSEAGLMYSEMRNVRLQIKDAIANMEDERTAAFRRLHDSGQFVRLDKFRSGLEGSPALVFDFEEPPWANTGALTRATTKVSATAIRPTVWRNSALVMLN
jgi:hypothetical protein